jgi:hypothetical protein
MDNKLYHNNRTEEVAHIIERMPKQFGIRVTGIVLLLVTLLFLFGWLIRYPDMVRGQITINGRQAPVKLVSLNTGPISLLVDDSGKIVKSGEYIAIIKNSASPKDVILLDSLLKQTNLQEITFIKYRNFFPKDLKIGEIGSTYFNFLASLGEYVNYYANAPFAKQKEITKKLLQTQNNLKGKLIEDYSLQEKIYNNAQSLYGKDSMLFSEGLLSKADFEGSAMQKLGKEQSYKSVEKQITNTEYQINDASYNLKAIDIKKDEKERELSMNLINSYFSVIESIRTWEKKYAFIAPVSGKVEFLSFLKNNDYVQTGQELFKIVPDQNELIGEVYLPEQGSGKVVKGQDVIIKLDNYPYTQYGSIEGKVSNISLVTNQQALSSSQGKINSYLVIIRLPQGLKTNYGSLLNFHYEARGFAEIITDKRRLIERLFDNLRYRLR